MKLYFAYGSNLDKAQFERRCPGSEPMMTAELHGYSFAFRGSGYADIIRKKGATVRGALYRVTPRNIVQLDFYEGTPVHYRRITVLVRCEDGKTRRAICYKMNDGMEEYPPTLGYIMTVICGCRDWGLDPDKVAKEALDRAQDTLTVPADPVEDYAEEDDDGEGL